MIQRKENVQKATERRNVVLNLMNRHGYITKQEMEEAIKVDVEKGLKPATQLQTRHTLHLWMQL